MARVEQVTQETLMLGEGPHWDTWQQCLFFVDIERKTLHKYDPATDAHVTSAPLDGRVGFVIPVSGARDHFVVGVEREVWAVEWAGAAGTAVRKLRRLAEVDHDEPSNRINDAKADPRGRLFFGTMGPKDGVGNFSAGRGSLYRLDGGVATTLRTGVGISNGLAWDLRRSACYYIDSLEHAVSRFDYDVATGEISSKSSLVSVETGFPDGMTIDGDGRLWVAVFGDGRVVQVDPETGAVLLSVRIPAAQVTSVAWGGADLDALFVTTASLTIGGEQPTPAGALFRVTGLQAKGMAPTEVKLV